MMNKTIKLCIDKLSELEGSLRAVNEQTEGAKGINFAFSLAKDSISTRISLLGDFLGDADTVNGICAEFIQGAIDVLSSDRNSVSDDEYGVAFKQAISAVTERLAAIRDEFV